jgi:hypothetical protein
MHCIALSRRDQTNELSKVQGHHTVADARLAFFHFHGPPVLLRHREPLAAHDRMRNKLGHVVERVLGIMNGKADRRIIGQDLVDFLVQF